MKRIALMVGGPIAALLCAGLAGADGTSQRSSTPGSSTAKEAPNKEATVNKGPGKPQAPPQKAAKRPQKAPVDEADVADDVAEGNDGAEGSGEEATNDLPPPPLRPGRPTTAGTQAPSSANQGGVDGPMVMGLMGGSINQLMRGGVMNMCPCASRSTLVQVTKVPKGVSISYVSDDPKVVEKLQKMAEGVRLMRDAWAD
jgi:hypothetical protein